ncbi:glycoside hydrolase [Mucilaginibacter agri]|uniref:Glycoside hydrolase n=1 Tax=Mucilaginibacter agri TaxID=2695265 RepID=A0A965ZKG2_9SPHI|nr:glycoside hydrolase [Mucilaginibacter agri]NCD71311.1 glycoside hydrolase [Mucilaginibacter agri]
MYKKFLTTSILVCCCVLASLAVIADLNGKWIGSVNMQGNDLALTYTFKVDGDKLTGVAESPYGPSAIENGKVKGDSLMFTTNVSGIEIPQSGKFFSDSVTLNIEVQGSVLHTTLKRAQ